jgi:methyl-accepting chemotaxis protein
VSVKQTGQGMDTIRIRTADAAEKVKQMGNRSKEIGRIVETIDDIADKTDMLALNAAVEAARAGEHGRGFAVVADQVRKLSESSKTATRDITDLIERVQETVNQAVAAMESTSAEVDNGMQLVGDTNQSLQDILQVAEEAVAMAEQISRAVAQLVQKRADVAATVDTVGSVVEENTASAEELAANSQEVTEAMEGVAGIAEENSASTEEVSASAEEMSAQVEEVVASAEELSALAEELNAAANQFRLKQTGVRQSEHTNGESEYATVPDDSHQAEPIPDLEGYQDNGRSS